MLLGKAIARQPVTEKKVMTTQELLKYRFDFHLSVLKGYVRYAQEVESKTKLQVTEEVNRVADRLIGQYNFGSQFMHDIHRYVNDRYVQSGSNVFDKIKTESGLPGELFNQFADELIGDAKLKEVHAQFSPRFRSIFH